MFMWAIGRCRCSQVFQGRQDAAGSRTWLTWKSVSVLIVVVVVGGYIYVPFSTSFTHEMTRMGGDIRYLYTLITRLMIQIHPCFNWGGNNCDVLGRDYGLATRSEGTWVGKTRGCKSTELTILWQCCPWPTCIRSGNRN